MTLCASTSALLICSTLLNTQAAIASASINSPQLEETSDHLIQPGGRYRWACSASERDGVTVVSPPLCGSLIGVKCSMQKDTRDIFHNLVGDVTGVKQRISETRWNCRCGEGEGEVTRHTVLKREEEILAERLVSLVRAQLAQQLAEPTYEQFAIIGHRVLASPDKTRYNPEADGSGLLRVLEVRLHQFLEWPLYPSGGNRVNNRKLEVRHVTYELKSCCSLSPFGEPHVSGCAALSAIRAKRPLQAYSSATASSRSMVTHSCEHAASIGRDEGGGANGTPL
ncbi:hypothetical protein Tco_0677390 [Tanacetum coccineum]|uniref:Uncharacterized protein n=1 Tax=Tanacetum coccineum TaxID=301880 RepID=A0ABQ4XCA0_9ASTR